MAASRTLAKMLMRSGVAFVAQIYERSARAFALLADRIAVRQRAPQVGLVVDRPAGPVLHALMPGGEEVAVHARGFAALLDQLDLHVAGIGQRDGDVNVVVALAQIGEGRHRQPVRVEPGPDAAHFGPVLHRCLDVAHHDANLAHISEQPAHGDLR
jgi:hypothetical protein